MSRYIDADEFADFIKRWGQGSSLEDVIEWLQTGEAADVVEVVRCDQCRHFDAINNDDHGWCKLISDLPCEMSVRYDDDYCSFGERAEA